MIFADQFREISYIWGSATRPVVCAALGNPNGAIDTDEYLNLLKGEFQSFSYPNQKWSEAFQLIDATFPSRLESVKSLGLLATVCERLASICFRYAWELSEQRDHQNAIYAAAVLWEVCIDSIGLEQRHLDWDHVLYTYGLAVQQPDLKPRRDELLEKVRAGEEVFVYRVIRSHSSRYDYAHFWALDPPSRSVLTESAEEEKFAHKYGLPNRPAGFKSIVTAKLTDNGPWLLQPSIAMDDRIGGEIEALCAWGSTKIIQNEDAREFFFRLFHSF